MHLGLLWAPAVAPMSMFASFLFGQVVLLLLPSGLWPVGLVGVPFLCGARRVVQVFHPDAAGSIAAARAALEVVGRRYGMEHAAIAGVARADLGSSKELFRALRDAGIGGLDAARTVKDIHEGSERARATAVAVAQRAQATALATARSAIQKATDAEWVRCVSSPAPVMGLRALHSLPTYPIL